MSLLAILLKKVDYPISSSSPSIFPLITIFVSLFTDDGGGIFDDRDIDRVRADDYYLHGFLLIAKMDKQDALNKMTDALKWRKEMGMNGRYKLHS